MFTLAISCLTTSNLPWFMDLTFQVPMATHSSTLAWKIPRMKQPGRLQSMGSLRVGHDWATSLSLFTFMHWRKKWQPTPVFLPGESQGWGSLVGCHLWGRTESDKTEVTYSSSSKQVRCNQIWPTPNAKKKKKKRNRCFQIKSSRLKKYNIILFR